VRQLRCYAIDFFHARAKPLHFTVILGADDFLKDESDHSKSAAEATGGTGARQRLCGRCCVLAFCGKSASVFAGVIALIAETSQNIRLVSGVNSGAPSAPAWS